MQTYKQENRQKLEGGIKNKELVCTSKPITMWLECTSRCNFKCVTCPRSYLPFFKGKDMKSDVFEIVKRELFPYLEIVRFQSFGEPMLAVDFERMYDSATENNIRINFCTNGMFLTERWIRKILHDGTHIQVSLDGALEHTMQEIRKGSNYKRIINSLILFRDLKKSEYIDSKADITIHFVAIRSNIKELPELIQLARELNINRIIVLEYCVTIQSLLMRKESLRRSKELANKYYLFAKEKANKIGISLKVPFYSIEGTKLSARADSANRSDYRFPQKCYAPWNSVLVRCNGDITPCCGSAEIMGNIKEGFWNVWNNRKYQIYRRRSNTNMAPLDCRNCVQPFGINAGNPENAKQYESIKYRVIYSYERVCKLVRYVYHYLKDYKR